MAFGAKPVGLPGMKVKAPKGKPPSGRDVSSLPSSPSPMGKVGMGRNAGKSSNMRFPSGRKSGR